MFPPGPATAGWLVHQQEESKRLPPCHACEEAKPAGLEIKSGQAGAGIPPPIYLKQ